MTPHISPVINQIPMKPGALLYRGLNDFELEELTRTGRVVLRPREKTYFEHSLGLYFVQQQQLSTEHVLDVRRRFLSLSLSEQIAHWYATSGGYDDGVLAVYRVPEQMTAENTSGNGLSLWLGVPDRVPAFYDARRALYADDIDAWQEGTNRSEVDHEILLVEGDLQPIELRRAHRSECPTDVKPWVKWGYSQSTSGAPHPNRPPRRLW